VAVGIDYRQDASGRTEVAVRGWERGSGRSVEEVLDGLADSGMAAVVVTSIERDGMLAGPDIEGLAAVLRVTDLPVIASGGVASATDIRRLASLEVDSDLRLAGQHDRSDGPRRLAGAITGKALVDGRLTVEEGVAACTPSG
jgi:phosphoribosylformimino-5-aminoimidazole carboxamide ribotide isomerase